MTAPSQVIGRQSANKVLACILKTYPGSLSVTGSLVILENGLDLLYPVAAGIAIDAILQGNVMRALAMVGLILSFWLIGALRRAVDTRIYTRIYADLADDVVLGERRLGIESSLTIVHTTLARQFVDFFEIQVPAFVTALISVIGSVGMLLILEPPIGFLAFVALAVSFFAALRFMRLSEFIAACLHSRQELEPDVIVKGSPLRITRHFRVLGGRRIQLSDLEARAYVGVGIVAALLFGALFTYLAKWGSTSAGEIYMLMSYIWTFVFSLDDMPEQIQQIGRLRELGHRIAPSLDDSAEGYGSGASIGEP